MDFKEMGENLGLDEDEFRELVELFITTGRSDHSKLENAIAQKDVLQIRATAHTLAGAAGNLGLMELHEFAKKIEMDAIDNNLDNIESDSQNIGKRIEDLASFVGS